MRVLIIENRGPLIGVLDSFIRDTYSFVRELHGNDVIDVAYTVNEAVSWTKDRRYDLIFFDPYVEGKGMNYLYSITPNRSDFSSDRAHRRAIAFMPPVVILGGESVDVPKECVFVKKVLSMPFDAERLKQELFDITESPARDRMEKPRAIAIDPRAELKKLELTIGSSYIYASHLNDLFHHAASMFAQAGYEVVVVTTAMPKIVREDLGLDLDSDVFRLDGDCFPLGTAVGFVQEHIMKNKELVVCIDNFDLMVEKETLGRMLMFLNEILSTESENKFTVLASMSKELLTDNIVDIIERRMELRNYGKD
ncbi:MAG: hypothetical protein MJZ68_08585 [archaeon]|nr:hypothetical protein [archaeon]